MVAYSNWIKKGLALFSWKQALFNSLIVILASRLQSQKIGLLLLVFFFFFFFALLRSCMCTTLVFECPRGNKPTISYCTSCYNYYMYKRKSTNEWMMRYCHFGCFRKSKTFFFQFMYSFLQLLFSANSKEQMKMSCDIYNT